MQHLDQSKCYIGPHMLHLGFVLGWISASLFHSTFSRYFWSISIRASLISAVFSGTFFEIFSTILGTISGAQNVTSSHECYIWASEMLHEGKIVLQGGTWDVTWGPPKCYMGAQKMLHLGRRNVTWNHTNVTFRPEQMLHRPPHVTSRLRTFLTVRESVP